MIRRISTPMSLPAALAAEEMSSAVRSNTPMSMPRLGCGADAAMEIICDPPSEKEHELEGSARMEIDGTAIG